MSTLIEAKCWTVDVHVARKSLSSAFQKQKRVGVTLFCTYLDSITVLFALCCKHRQARDARTRS